MSTRNLEDSSGIFSRVNRTSATTARISTARACVLGGGGRAIGVMYTLFLDVYIQVLPQE